MIRMDPVALSGALTGAVEEIATNTNLRSEFLLFIETYNIFGVAV